MMEGAQETGTAVHVGAEPLDYHDGSERTRSATLCLVLDDAGKLSSAPPMQGCSSLHSHKGQWRRCLGSF